MIKRASLHGHWSSRTAFILAVTGSAVGLGNVWKFPYIAGENGGGAFVLVYLLCVVVIGLPIMMSEVMLGRRGRRNPISTMQALGQEEAHNSKWGLLGLNGIVAGILILSFYSVIGGWSLSYVFYSADGLFRNASAEQVGSLFSDMLADWKGLLFAYSVFVVMTIIVVAGGVERGLEKAVRILMPALFLMQLVLLVYAYREGDWTQGMLFLFKPDWSALTGEVFLLAMGQAFFTLSIGMGAVMAYGAYLPQDTSILNTSVMVIVADTVVALLAGMIIFPIMFQYGLSPTEGEGLVFKTLPIAFGNMGGGVIVGTLFFLLLVLGAWTSAIGLLEPAVAWFIERIEVKRWQAAWLMGLMVWLLGCLSVFSFNLLADVQFFQGTLFDNIDYVATNILLPISGLFIALFAGWKMCQNSSSVELDIGADRLYQGWRLLIRWIAPIAVAAIFCHGMGWLSF